jgi:hypothetical protein
MIFGPRFPGFPRTVEYRHVRKFGWKRRAKAFKARCDELFVKQVAIFSTPKTWAPFPLAVMTCIGIEMIGAYKYGDALNDRNRHFRRLVEDMDPPFAKSEVNPKGQKVPLSDFIYYGFRHSLIHGFYGRWVFLTHRKAETPTWKYRKKRRHVFLNVYWFYSRFRQVYDDYFQQLLRCTSIKEPLFVVFRETFQAKFGHLL